MSTSRTLPIDLLQAAVDIAARQGWNVSALLAEAAVSPVLLKQRRSRWTDDQLVLITQHLWRRTDDELFGLGRQALPRGSFRLLCYGMSGSHDLHEALERVQGFVRAMPALPLFVELGPQETRIVVPRAHGGAAEQIVDLIGLAAAHRLICWLVGQPIPLTRVETSPDGPLHQESLRLLFAAPLLPQTRWSAIVFSSEFLASRVLRIEPDIESFVAASPRGLLRRPPAAVLLSERVRRILERSLKRGEWPTAAELAAEMSMATQTLRRGLAREGTSLRQLNDEIRRDLAVNSLVSSQESIAELATRLGFSEPRAFTRAFRRWTGTTPATYRSEVAKF